MTDHDFSVSFNTTASVNSTMCEGFLFKLLGGRGRGQLNNFIPKVVDLKPTKVNRNTTTGLQLLDQTKSNSLLVYERGIMGSAPKLWEKIPQNTLKSGLENGWQSITKECQRFLTGKLKSKDLNSNDTSSKGDDNDQLIKSTIYA